MRKKILIVPWLCAILAVIGCESQDERVAQLATENVERQAAQNTQMAQLQQEVAAGARSLIEANAQARQEVLAMQKGLQGERLEINRQRDLLGAERRAIAEERRTAPIIAEAITDLGLCLACLLPLVVCWHLLRYSRDESDQGLSELLIHELSWDRQLLLPPQIQPPSPDTGPDEQLR